MSLPVDLLLVRHALSVDNARRAENYKDKDEEQQSKPDSQVELAPDSEGQIKKTRQWLLKNHGPRFDLYWVAPFRRTRITAGSLDLPEAQWDEKNELRERSMGTLRNVPRNDDRFQGRALDPFYWKPEEGERVAEVCESRVRLCYEELSESEVGSAIVITSGIVISCFRMRIQSWTVEEYNKQYNSERNGKSWIHNCSILWYSRRNPETKEVVPGRYQWVRQTCPWDLSLSGNTWEHIPERKKLSNQELIGCA